MEKETKLEQRQKLQVPEYVQKVPDSPDWKIQHLQHQEGEQISNDKWIWKHVHLELYKH